MWLVAWWKGFRTLPPQPSQPSLSPANVHYLAGGWEGFLKYKNQQLSLAAGFTGAMRFQEIQFNIWMPAHFLLPPLVLSSL